MLIDILPLCAFTLLFSVVFTLVCPGPDLTVLAVFMCPEYPVKQPTAGANESKGSNTKGQIMRLSIIRGVRVTINGSH